MHRHSALLALVALFACSGSDSTPTELHPSLATGGTGCTISLTAGKTFPLSPTTNSTATVKFTAKNIDCNSNSDWGAPTVSRTGAVATITGVTPGPPTILAKGASKTFTVSFTTGPTAGPGTVTMKFIVDSPGATLIETANMTVSGPTATGIPFGFSGINPDTVPNGDIWTGGTGSFFSVPQILTHLSSAQMHTPRIREWLYFTMADENLFMDANRNFLLNKWKQTLDDHAGTISQVDGSSQYASQLQQYMQPGGALVGMLMLDDLGNFNQGPTFSDLEAMATHAKLRYPGILTAVRQRPSKLPVGVYTKLDVAWAQYEAKPAANDGLPADQYRDFQIQEADNRRLGLVFAITATKAALDGSDIPPATLLSWGQQLLAAGTSDYACGFNVWDSKYSGLTSPPSPQVATLANLAKNHVASPCKVH